MGQARTRALWGLGIWTPLGALFAFLFFSWGGPVGLVEERWRIFGTAVVIGTGFLSWWAVLWGTSGRRGPGRDPDAVIHDERDERIARRANGATLVVTLLFVYATSIVLYELYHDAGGVPVGWLYFLAYFTIVVAHVGHAVATLAVDSALGGHAEG